MEWDLYVITDSRLSRGRPVVEVVRQALEGGARIIQLREKEMPPRELVALGRELRSLIKSFNATFIVNDRLDVALAVDADGVHVGQDDLPAAVARRLLGPGKILGVSVATVEEALRALADGADYLGVGSIYATGTKPDAGAPIGPARIKEIKSRVNLPVVAIGGINAANAGEVIAAGADGVAVISAVVGADDVRAAAAELLAVVRRSKSGLLRQDNF
ncbi:MAG: thiamine-phosphate pyrophosphorylase [Clostridia bacterium]|nr:thiamine-phosphate pyrophosphorylase [Clostridia bacterium]